MPFNLTMKPETLEQTLHHEIPLSRAMELSVIDASASQVTLQAPLAPNINHKSTAFGGSLYCVAVLTGWSLIWTQLQQRGLAAHIVIQQSDTEYLAPVTGAIRATCRLASEAAFERALRLFERRGKARIALQIEIAGAQGTAVHMSGNYVIHH
jgi:thioesterase domain-containing protein